MIMGNTPFLYYFYSSPLSYRSLSHARVCLFCSAIEQSHLEPSMELWVGNYTLKPGYTGEAMILLLPDSVTCQ